MEAAVALDERRLASGQEEVDAIAEHIRRKARNGSVMEILEAGCGRRWGINLEGVRYTLTGVDSDESALEIRKNQIRDLDVAILGDLRTVDLAKSSYDVIFNSYVLEHISGAEKVLDNFLRWLKPGGMLVLIIPNRDSVKGFFTRTTPMWFHVMYQRHILGYTHAGKPGYGPFPTPFDEIVSRRGIRRYCDSKGLHIRAEYCAGHGRKIKPVFLAATKALFWFFHLASFRRLSSEYTNIIYIIEKPESA